MYSTFNAGHVFGISSFFLLPVSLYAYRGVAPLFVITVVLTLITWFYRRPAFSIFSNQILFACIALPVWGFLSSAWSPIPAITFLASLSLLATIAGAFILFITAISMTENERSIFSKCILWSGGFGFGLMSLDLFLMAYFFGSSWN